MARVSFKTVSRCGFTPPEFPIVVCRKCAVRFGPVCAKVRRFNTGAKRFRAGLDGGNLLICRSESRKAAFRVQPTLISRFESFRSTKPSISPDFTLDDGAACGTTFRDRGLG